MLFVLFVYSFIYIFCLDFHVSDPCYSILFESESLTEPKLWKSWENNFKYFPINEKRKNSFAVAKKLDGDGFTDILKEDIKGLIEEQRET